MQPNAGLTTQDMKVVLKPPNVLPKKSLSSKIDNQTQLSRELPSHIFFIW